MTWIGAILLAAALQKAAPTTDRILYSNENDLWVMEADGSNAKGLTTGTDRKIQPAWSPDGKKIAFVQGGMPSDVWVMNADGSDVRNVTQNKGFKNSSHSPAWSPDGKRIAYVFGDTFANDVWVMKADGSSKTGVTKESISHRMPAWSHDGRRIVVVTAHPVKSGDARSFNDTEITIVNADGSGPRMLTKGDAIDGSPAFSPDGARIVFVSKAVKEKKENVTILENEEIWIMKADGSGLKNISNNPVGEDHWPAWSPDGSKIAFVARKNGGPTSLYLMDAEGGNVKELETPKWGPKYSRTQWFADGTKLLALDGDSDIVVVKADGSGVTKIGSGMNPVVSPGKGSP